MNTKQMERICHGRGFIAALDQSGGSTPKALAAYGIDQSAYSSESEMFDLVHQMRQRIVTAPDFNSEKVLGAILFSQTMEREVEGMSTPEYLWVRRGVVPFLKVDLGLAPENKGVQLMKPFEQELDALLAKAKNKGIYGTKMRSLIHHANPEGIAGVVTQQFDYATKICTAGFVPIVEPEVDIKSEDKMECEVILKAELLKALDQLDESQSVMLKLSLPVIAGFYDDLASHPRVQRVVALSGGYDRDQACEILKENKSMIASFSRALVEGLTAQMSDQQFNQAIGEAIEQIYQASIKN